MISHRHNIQMYTHLMQSGGVLATLMPAITLGLRTEKEKEKKTHLMQSGGVLTTPLPKIKVCHKKQNGGVQ